MIVVIDTTPEIRGTGTTGRTLDPDPEPSWRVASLAAQTTALSATLVGSIRDTNNLGQTPNRVSVTAQYRLGTSGSWTNAGTEIISGTAFRIATGNIRPLSYSGETFQARAYVGTVAATQAFTEFTLGITQGGDVVGTPTATPSGTTSITVTTTISTPVPTLSLIHI